MDGMGSIPGSARLFSSPQCPDQLWGSPSLLSNRYQGLLPPGDKGAGHEADHSLPSSIEFNKGGAIPPLPHMST
jgi:hypothetical protein